MEFLFWFSVGFIVYLYIGYPLVLWVIASFKNKEQEVHHVFEPKISFIITAHNEEKVIGEKIKNTLTLDYPIQKMDIMVVSDGSTDRTEDIVRGYAKDRIKLISTKKRFGKTESQNRAVVKAKGDILIFSDANSFYRKDAIRMLVRHFTNTKVGCVGGKLGYTAEEGAAQGESLYLRWGTKIKSLESQACSTVGVDGGIYAIRKEAYIPLNRYMISDFVEPILIYKRGWKVKYDKNASMTENLPGSIHSSLKRRVRIFTRAFNSLKYVKDILNPFRWGFFSIEVISHKVLTWFQPLFFIGLFLSNAFLITKIPFRTFFILQTLFYICGVLGLLFQRVKVFRLPAYFLGMNFALIISWVNLARGKDFITWEPKR